MTVKVFSSQRRTAPVAKLTIPTAVPPFDPATLALSAWWRPNYPASLPWLGTDSAGTSGDNDITQDAGGDPALTPTQVSALGYTVPQFNGIDKRLFTTPLTMSDFVDVDKYTIIVLFYANAAGAKDETNRYNETAIISDSSGGAIVGCGIHSDAGTIRFSAYHYDPDYTGPATDISALFGWVMATARYDGTTLTVKAFYSSGASSSASQLKGNIVGGLASPVSIGADFAGTVEFDGFIGEIMMAKSHLSDADLVNIKGYFNSRYSPGGLAL